MVETRNAYQILMGKLLEIRPIRRPMRWKDIIETDLGEKSCEGKR
jgi:hypothetical protein